MKSTRWFVGYALVGWMALCGGAVRAGDSSAAVTLDAAFLSGYMWRGQAYNDEVVLQPAATVAKGAFTASVWGNYNLTDRVTGEKADFSEVDVTLSFAGKFGPVGASAGLIEYVFPNQTAGEAAAQGTREVFVSLSLPDYAVVPSLGVYRDIDEVDGTYLTAGLAYTAPMCDTLSLTVSGSVGYGDKDYNGIYFGVGEAAWNDANVGLALTWKVCGTVSIVPSVQYTTLIDSGVKDSAKASAAADGALKDDSLVVGGVKVSWAF